jgi:hypothetical protein
MTTITIQVPDSKSSVITTIADIIKKAGLDIIIDNDEDNLSESEFKSLQNASEEAVLIKKGLKKATPASELWND